MMEEKSWKLHLVMEVMEIVRRGIKGGEIRTTFENFVCEC